MEAPAGWRTKGGGGGGGGGALKVGTLGGKNPWSHSAPLPHFWEVGAWRPKVSLSPSPLVPKSCVRAWVRGAHGGGGNDGTFLRPPQQHPFFFALLSQLDADADAAEPMSFPPVPLARFMGAPPLPHIWGRGGGGGGEGEV